MLFPTDQLYSRYRVTLKSTGWIVGGTPKDPKLIQSWIRASTKPKTGPALEDGDVLTDQQILEAQKAMEDQQEQGSWNGFRRDENGLYLETRCIKAMFRECLSVLGTMRVKRGSKQILQHGFEIKGLLHPSRVYLDRREPDGSDEKPIHVQTAQGPRDALKRIDYVENVEFTFDVWVLGTHASESRHIGEKELTAALTLGQENGLGADRSQGHGKFEVTRFEVLQRCVIGREKTATNTAQEPS